MKVYVPIHFDPSNGCRVCLGAFSSEQKANEVLDKELAYYTESDEDELSPEVVELILDKSDKVQLN